MFSHENKLLVSDALSKEKNQKLADYLKGLKLYIHPLHVLDMLQQICQLIDERHMKGLLTEAIKLENFNINPATGKISLDVGNTQGSTSNTRSFSRIAGVVMGELLGIVDGAKTILIPKAKINQFNNRQASEQIYQLISDMLDENKEKNINSTFVLSALLKLERLYSANPLQVCVIDLVEFDAKKVDDKVALFQEIISHSHEVKFQAPHEYVATNETLELIYQLQVKGIRIHEKILPDEQNLQNGIRR